MTVEVSSLMELVEQASGAESSLDTQEYFVNMGPQHER